MPTSDFRTRAIERLEHSQRVFSHARMPAGAQSVFGTGLSRSHATAAQSIWQHVTLGDRDRTLE